MYQFEPVTPTTVEEDCPNCILCGKPVHKPHLFVRVYWGDSILSQTEHDAMFQQDQGSGDLGLQAIGTGCLANHPGIKPYLVKNGEK